MAKSPSKYWTDELGKYRKKYERYHTVGKNIVERYRSDQQGKAPGTQFNILRSNVAVLKPALYARPPQPVVSRRYKDRSPVARVASTILERCLSYEITQLSDYDSALSNAVMDRLLPGRGVAWVRYEPTTENQKSQLTEDIKSEEAEPLLEITGETSPCDYVYWKDFAHNSNARTWEEVTWVGRKVCIGLEEGRKRFGDIFLTLPNAKQEDNPDDTTEYTEKKSVIWEIWHKPTKKAIWVCEGYENTLDERPDPLGLQDFFPCPKPLFSDLTTDTLIPRPDYTLYQDQAQELDRVTAKIDELVQQIEIKGFYDKSQTGLANVLQPGNNGKMFPLDNFMALVEKGGIDRAVDYFPIDPQIKALQQLYQQRESLIQMIYELSGISDIQRGASQASETATAQQIKAQFSSIRLGKMKAEVAEFAKQLLRMKAEIMAEKYQPETLVQMSGIMDMPEVQQNPEIVSQAIMLLKNEVLRNFAIDIESDTLVEMDEKAEQQSRIEFLGALTPYMEKALLMVQQAPETLPLVGEIMLFAIRGFKVGQSTEATFETFFESLQQQQEEQKNAPPQPPQPTPEELQMQAEQQARQMDMEIRAQDMQAKAASEQQKLQFDSAKAEQDAQIRMAELQAKNEMEIRKLEMERWKVERQEQTKLLIAKMGHENAIKVANMKPDEMNSYDDDGNEKPSSGVEALVSKMAEANASLVDAIVQSNTMLAREMSRPKRLVRDADGNKMAIPVED